MAENTEKKTLYTSAALEELFGEQLKALRKFDKKKMAKAIENQLQLGEESLPYAFRGFFKFNVPILQAVLKPHIYEDRFGKGAAATDTYFVQSGDKISAVIHIIGQDNCLGPIDTVPEHIHVFTVDELQEKVNETIGIFQGEIDRLKQLEKDGIKPELTALMNRMKMDEATNKLVDEAKAK